MAFLQALSSILCLLLVAHASTASLVHDKCDSFAADDKESYDFCEKTLGTDRASATANEFALAAIAARAARAAAKATGARIARLQVTDTMPTRRDCLAKCAAEYDAAVRRLGRAARHAGHGGTTELDEAQTLLAEVLDTPTRCDSAFAAAGQRSPLTVSDHKLDDMVSLALAILPQPPRTPITRA